MASSFGILTDYFNAGGQSLKLVSSSDGAYRQHVAVSQTGDVDAHQTGPVLYNPSCTYRIVKDVTISSFLGKAYQLGFFLTSVVIDTSVGDFPTVTFAGTANEGANAINQFSFSVNVSANAHAQNLLNAISGGGELQSMSLSIECDPVVVYENLSPCASDVTHGKIVASAITGAYNGEAAPSANNGFIEIGTPKNQNDVDFMSWNIEAVKYLGV